MRSVSVIIPCYNYAHFLPECVESVLSQPGVDVRILIIDDASPDNTAEVAARLTAQDTRVEFRRHLKNMGHIATYNEGLAWASGDYTVLLSADDMLTSGALLRATQLMDLHPEVGFVYGGCIRFFTDQPLPHSRSGSASGTWQIYNGLDWLEMACKTGRTWIISPEVVVRTSIQHQLGGYRPELPHTGDQEMWMRFAVRSAAGQITDADQAFYRMHGQNMHVLQYSAILQDIQERKVAFDSLFRDYKDSIPGWERLRKMAVRNLAIEALWETCKAMIHRQGGKASIKELFKFALDSDRGKRFDLEYLRISFGLSYRILRRLFEKAGLIHA